MIVIDDATDFTLRFFFIFQRERTMMISDKLMRGPSEATKLDFIKKSDVVRGFSHLDISSFFSTTFIFCSSSLDVKPTLSAKMK